MKRDKAIADFERRMKALLASMPAPGQAHGQGLEPSTITPAAAGTPAQP